jgi:serine/threonine protein kinase
MSEKTLGRYQLLDRLGAGGMAEVWLADQTGPRGFRRRCVIKRIHSHLNAQEDFVARFEDEARLAAMLRHPNIVRVEDFGEAGGNLFMALEYIDGWEFSDLLRRGAKSDHKISDALALDVIIQIAEALDYAHSLRGSDGQPLRIVHRDVSPQNILIERGTGAAKLLDFGIASAESNLHETQAGLIKGKIAYFSPEQARGDALDCRTDLYALGLVLHEALIGKRVFRGESMVQLLRDVSDARVPSLIYKRPDLPRGLLAAVDRSTAPSRNDRFPDGMSLAAALREGLDEIGGLPPRGAMDRWVGELPSPSELPHTGSTSSVSMATSLPANSDGIATDHGLAAEPANETIAAMVHEPQTILASAKELASAAVAQPEEGSDFSDSDGITEANPSPLRQGPTELDTREFKTERKPFPAMLLASVVIVVLAVLVIALLVNPPKRLPAEKAAGVPAAKAQPVAAKPAVEPKRDAQPTQQAESKPPPVAKPVRATAKQRAVTPKRQRKRPVAQPQAPAVVVPAVVVVPDPPAQEGLAKRDLDAVTMRNFQALANCRQGATGIIIKLQIHKNGMPFGVRITGASTEANTCLRKIVRKWRYPAHGGSTVRHSIKL